MSRPPSARPKTSSGRTASAARNRPALDAHPANGSIPTGTRPPSRNSMSRIGPPPTPPPRSSIGSRAGQAQRLATAVGERLMTGMARPPSALKSSIRPVTQQGLSGGRAVSRLGTASTRQVLDKSYYIGILRAKMIQINAEISRLQEVYQKGETARMEMGAYEKRAQEGALELKEQQGRLIDYNVIIGRMHMNSDMTDIEVEAKRIKENADEVEASVQELFAERKELEMENEQTMAEVEEQKKLNHDPGIREKYEECKTECDSLKEEVEQMQNEILSLDDTRHQLEIELENSPLKKQAIQMRESIVELEAKEATLLKENGSKETPEQKKQKLINNIKSNNEDIVTMEKQIEKITEQINLCYEEIREFDTDADQRHARNNEKHRDLLAKENEYDEFLAGYEQQKQLLSMEMEEYSQGVVRILQKISANLGKVSIEGNVTDMDPDGLLILQERANPKDLQDLHVRLQEEIISLDEMETRLQSEEETLNKRLTELREQLEQYSNVHQLSVDVEKDMKDLETRRDQLEQELPEREQNHEQLTQRLNLLQEQLDSNPNYATQKNLIKKLEMLNENNTNMKITAEAKESETKYEHIKTESYLTRVKITNMSKCDILLCRMRSTFHGGGVTASPRTSMNEEAEGDYPVAAPIFVKNRYGREDLLALVGKESQPPDGLPACPLFVSIALQPIVCYPLSELEQRLQHNINSSKAMSSLTHAERASVAAGSAFGGTNGSPSTGATPSSNTPQKSSGGGWTPVKSWILLCREKVEIPGRGGGQVAPSGTSGGTGALRGGGVGRPYIPSRGGARVTAGDTTMAGSTDESSSTPFGQRFAGRGRGGPPTARGGSTTANSFNSRAQGLYDPRDPKDRPRNRLRSTSEEGDTVADNGGNAWTSAGCKPAWVNNSKENSTNAWNKEPTWSRENSISSASVGTWKNENGGTMPEWMEDGDEGEKEESSDDAISGAGSFDEQGRFRQQGNVCNSSPVKKAVENADDESTHLSSVMFVLFVRLFMYFINNSCLDLHHLLLYQIHGPLRPFRVIELNPHFLRIHLRRNVDTAYKTLGELMQTNGHLTPFDYKDEVVVPPTSVYNATPSSFGALFGSASLWNEIGPSSGLMYGQPTYDPIAVERKVKKEEKERRKAEEADREKRAEEAAEKERNRLRAAAEAAAEKIRQHQAEAQKKQELIDEELRKKAAAAEREKRKQESTKFEIEQVWESASKPKFTSSSTTDDDAGWQTTTKKSTSKGYIIIRRILWFSRMFLTTILYLVAPWSASAVGVPREKTLKEIQEEEEKQMKAEQAEQARLKKEQQLDSSMTLQSSGTWSNASQRIQWNQPQVTIVKSTVGKPAWGGAGVEPPKATTSPFWDGPSLQAANKIAQPVKKTVAPKSIAMKNPSTKSIISNKSTWSATEETAKKALGISGPDPFISWVIQRVKQLSSTVDAEVLATFIESVENPDEVKEFVREFLHKRSDMRGRKGTTKDDLSSASGAPAAGTGLGGPAHQGKKKKNKGARLVVDGACLGFRATSDPNRVNQGEIETLGLMPGQKR
uniref:Intraflagellar transport protein 74 homolog n=1 Tax=Heterorhabditis bacteriophora TaxID=37862 RepID=A0A1I7XPA0_HETBA